MAKIICLAQYKGGTGKTSSVLNIAACLAEKGKRVLVVDLDQQSNLTAWLGHDPAQLLGRNVANLLKDENDELNIKDFIVDTTEGIHLLPANIELVQAEPVLQTMHGGERQLAIKLEPVLSFYDFILIDTPPSSGQMGANAFAAADYLLIPVLPELLCVQGLGSLLKAASLTQRRLNPSLRTMGMFITFQTNKKLHQDITAQLRDAYGRQVFETEIKDRVAISESVSACQSIIKFSPRSDAAQMYRQLTEEVLKHAS